MFKSFFSDYNSKSSDDEKLKFLESEVKKLPENINDFFKRIRESGDEDDTKISFLKSNQYLEENEEQSIFIQFFDLCGYLIEKENKLTEFEIRFIVRGIVEGVFAIYKAGTSHGDLSTKNIIVHTVGKNVYCH